MLPVYLSLAVASVAGFLTLALVAAMFGLPKRSDLERIPMVPLVLFIAAAPFFVMGGFTLLVLAFAVPIVLMMEHV